MGMLMMTLWLATGIPVVAGPANISPPHSEFSESKRGCPAGNADAMWRIRNVLGSPLIAEMRQHVDLGTASLAEVRPLRLPEDREACVKLWEALDAEGTVLQAADAISFYRSGDRYFVPISRRPPTRPGTIRLDGASAVHLYDAEYRLIARLAA